MPLGWPWEVAARLHAAQMPGLRHCRLDHKTYAPRRWVLAGVAEKGAD